MIFVNIVVGPADLPWIAGRFARELVARLPAHGISAEINPGFDPEVSVSTHRFVEYQQIVYDHPIYHPAVGLFTHGDYRPRRFGLSYDACIALSPAMVTHLRAADVPDDRIFLAPYPVDTDTYRLSRPLRFGVAGRTYSDGRKGEHLVAAMVAAGYDIRAWGSGWPCPIVGSDLSQLPEFYRSLDYYIDTSTDEGGCIPAAEAQACGVPVISHTFGVTRPVIAYERGSWESLSAVLRAITQPATYDDFAAVHAAAFKRALE